MRITLRLAVVLCALAAIVLPSTASAWKYIGTTGSYAGSVYMENVRGVLPNTRVLQTTFVVRG